MAKTDIHKGLDKVIYTSEKPGINAREVESELQYEKRMKSREINLGPRCLLFHYIYEMNMDENRAIDIIIKLFPSYDKKVISTWLKDKNAITIWLSNRNISQKNIFKDLDEER